MHLHCSTLWTQSRQRVRRQRRPHPRCKYHWHAPVLPTISIAHINMYSDSEYCEPTIATVYRAQMIYCHVMYIVDACSRISAHYFWLEPTSIAYLIRHVWQFQCQGAWVRSRQVHSGFVCRWYWFWWLHESNGHSQLRGIPTHSPRSCCTIEDSDCW